MLAAATTLAAPRPADASDDAAEIGGVTAAIVLAATDLSFFGHAIAVTARGEPVDASVSLAQAIVTGPQAIAFEIGMAAVATEGDGSEILAGMAPFGMVVNTLFIHGVWTTNRPEHDVREVFAASSVMGVNAGWTSVLIGYAIEPDMDMEPIGVAMALTSAINVGVSAPYALARPGFRSGWVGMAGWSTLLFAYGVAGALGVWTPEPENERGPGHAAVSDLTFGPIGLAPSPPRRFGHPPLPGAAVPSISTGAFGLRGRW
jgi:hypothetical protein